MELNIKSIHDNLLNNSGNNSNHFTSLLKIPIENRNELKKYKCCIENIGKGSFGNIQKGIDINTGKSIIIKTMNIDTREQNSFNTSMQTESLVASNNDIHLQESTIAKSSSDTSTDEEQNVINNLKPIVDSTITDSSLLSLTAEGQTILKKILKEITIMKQLKHENVIQYYDYTVDKSNYYKIMIYMEDVCGKTLTILFKLELTINFIRNIAKQLFTGIKYIHSQNVIHKDIKSNNILLSNMGIIKIIDFGESVIINKDKIKHISAGSPLYMAPEVIENKEISKNNSFKCDIWSAIIVMVELYIGGQIKLMTNEIIPMLFAIRENPYIILYTCIHSIYCKIIDSTSTIDYNNLSKNSMESLIKIIIRNIFEKTNNNEILSFIDLICLCLEPDIDKRYSANEVLQHPFIRNENNSYKSNLILNYIN